MPAAKSIYSRLQTLLTKTINQGFYSEEYDEAEIKYHEIGNDNIENIQYYNKGGHHPVHLGDILNDRYEVVHKLGSGRISTVWLCHDSVTSQWSAIKIITAKRSAEGREEKIYNHLLRKSSLKQLRRYHLLVPSQQFWVTGPNGRHYCIVLPVLGPTTMDWRLAVARDNDGQITDSLRNVCAQVVRGVEFLHQAGVCHGDLNPKNIMIEVENLETLSKDQVLKLFGEPEICKIEVESGESPVPRAPDYVVLPSRHAWWQGATTSFAYIVDFGTSYLTGTPSVINPLSFSYAPPEAIWGGTFELGPHSDIWSLAATLYQIVCGVTMFGNEHVGSTTRDIEFFLGSLPNPYRKAQYDGRCFVTRQPASYLVDQTRRNGSQLIDEDEWEVCPLRWEGEHLLEARRKMVEETGCSDHFEAAISDEKKYQPSVLSSSDLTDTARHKALKCRLPRESILGLADLLRKMLRYDPSKRINIGEVVGHQWLDRHVRSSIAENDIDNRIPSQLVVGITSVPLILLLAYVIQLPFSG